MSGIAKYCCVSLKTDASWGTCEFSVTPGGVAQNFGIGGSETVSVKDGNRDWSFQGRHCLVIISSKSSVCLLGQVDFGDAADNGVALSAGTVSLHCQDRFLVLPGPLSLKTEPRAEKRSVSLLPLAVASCVTNTYR